MAVAKCCSDNVSVLLGNGDGSFQAPQNFGAGGGPVSVAVGDFNGGGEPDLAVANVSSNNVSVLFNNTGPYSRRADLSRATPPPPYRRRRVRHFGQLRFT